MLISFQREIQGWNLTFFLFSATLYVYICCVPATPPTPLYINDQNHQRLREQAKRDRRREGKIINSTEHALLTSKAFQQQRQQKSVKTRNQQKIMLDRASQWSGSHEARGEGAG